MKITGNSILITGGATGIGLALAEVFLREGNQVLICGRRNGNLDEAQAKFPMLKTMVCDLDRPEGREALFHWATKEAPTLNILINNAGIQRQIDFTKGDEDLKDSEDEIGINFTAPVYLSAMFIPFLMDQQNPAIINITSGLGFVPLTIVPIYCATKAALHSFSISLRHQLRNTNVKVYEVIPPTVDTDLDRGARGRRGQQHRGITAMEVAANTLQGLKDEQSEIPIGQAEGLRNAGPQEKEAIFQRMNGNF